VPQQLVLGPCPPRRHASAARDAYAELAAWLASAIPAQEKPAAAGQLCFVLGNCPYRDAVRANQAVVCTLHRGLTRGMLDALQSGTGLRAFVPRDPDEAGCLIEIDAT
jgi:predicted ArsR family transcriptional regulator